MAKVECDNCGKIVDESEIRYVLSEFKMLKVCGKCFDKVEGIRIKKPSEEQWRKAQSYSVKETLRRLSGLK